MQPNFPAAQSPIPHPAPVAYAEPQLAAPSAQPNFGQTIPIYPSHAQQAAQMADARAAQMAQQPGYGYPPAQQQYAPPV